MKTSLPYKIVAEIICLIALFLFLFPLVLMLVKSFDNGGIGNYRKVFDYFNLLPNLCTSICVVSGTMILVAAACSMSAFAFSKLQFPGQRTIYYILLAGLMIPASALVFPVYQIVRMLNLNNTPWALIFPYATMNCCFNLMVLKNFYDALPNELIDAGRIDGANKLGIFLQIMLPVAKPGLAFVLIQTFLSSWNELQMALIFISDTDVQPLSVIPIKLAQTTTSNGFTLNTLYAALVICLAPIAIFYIFASRNLIEGMTSGAVKG